MSLDSAISSISEKVSSGSSFGATVKFNCGDAGVVYIDGNATPPTVSADDVDADCTISLDQETLEGMIAGDVDPTSAFMMGKLKVEGDMSVAMKLSSLF